MSFFEWFFHYQYCHKCCFLLPLTPSMWFDRLPKMLPLSGGFPERHSLCSTNNVSRSTVIASNVKTICSFVISSSGVCVSMCVVVKVGEKKTTTLTRLRVFFLVSQKELLIRSCSERQSRLGSEKSVFLGCWLGCERGRETIGKKLRLCAWSLRELVRQLVLFYSAKHIKQDWWRWPGRMLFISKHVAFVKCPFTTCVCCSDVYARISM